MAKLLVGHNILLLDLVLAAYIHSRKRSSYLSEDEKEQWDELDWDEDGNVPDRVEAAAVNQWLFNEDTVDKVLAHLMTRGLKVAGRDLLGKNIIFAKNNDHAKYIYERFNANYPHYNGDFARIITHKVEYAQNLIDSFSHPDKAPHIAISVDMLDTGIKCPRQLPQQATIHCALRAID
ncbi:hypothetical protein JOY44_10980 [Phormidium sp. CLA17]|uniref:hypothetical protein n=1 Tax=Leptolyngbya sp. Cla-17 TaxID=2803751 RepID=UPI001932134B|nr:hypothetical protein [Leptolyngbya sp. Cla-17]MBM0742140.1 hypothetical protein [Leptolyngbya sp. Cla-17]